MSAATSDVAEATDAGAAIAAALEHELAGVIATEAALLDGARWDEWLALWTEDARDWSAPGQDAIRRRVLAGLKPGAIILLHDTSAETAAVLPRLLRDVKARGYRFVPLGALAGGKP